jgi:hypothetical protein
MQNPITVSDGFWVFLKPLSPGKQKLKPSVAADDSEQDKEESKEPDYDEDKDQLEEEQEEIGQASTVTVNNVF